MIDTRCPFCGNPAAASTIGQMLVIGCPCVPHRARNGVVLNASLFDLPARVIEDRDPGDEQDPNILRQNRAAIVRERIERRSLWADETQDLR